MYVEHYLPSTGNHTVGFNDAVQNVQEVVGNRLEAGQHWDPGYNRPYFDKNGNPAVTVLTNRWTVEKGVRRRLKEHRLIADLVNNHGIMNPVFNATSLRKEEWIEVDRTVLEAARYRLRAWSDLAAASSFGGFDGMSKMVLEQETMSDPGEAIVDMDSLTEGRTDSPKFQLEGLPLPITHCDFWFSKRRLGISRNSGTPLDFRMANSAGQRVGESVEKTLIGNNTGTTYAGNSTQVGGYGRTSAVYGYTNFPTRVVKINLTTPTGSNPEATVADVLAMKDSMTARKMYGPFMLYHSTDWDQYMDNDYARLGGTNANMTLRDRLKKIDGIQDVRRLDMLFATAPQTDPYWTSSTVSTTGKPVYTGPGGEGVGTPGANVNPFTLIMVQMTPNVAQAVTGLPITTVQWETKGGMQLNFKVMTIQVPRLQADFYGNTGILQASTS